MTGKLQTKITFFIISFFIFAARAYAVDTTECFTPGIATDFEAYYSYGRDKDAASHNGEFLIGGGFTDTFSYYIAGAASREFPEEGDSFTTYGGFGLGLIWTAYEKENFIAVDLMPSYAFEPNDIDDDAKSAKPNFKGYSIGASAEINFMKFEKFQPYIIAGYIYYKETEETAPDKYEDSPNEFPLAAGFMTPAAEGIEVLGQFEWIMNEETKKWAETGRCAAIGVNIMLNDNLELITELSRSMKIEDPAGRIVCPAGWGIGIGMIFAL